MAPVWPRTPAVGGPATHNDHYAHLGLCGLHAITGGMPTAVRPHGLAAVRSLDAVTAAAGSVVGRSDSAHILDAW